MIMKIIEIIENMMIGKILRLYWWVAALEQWEPRPIVISWLVRFISPFLFSHEKFAGGILLPFLFPLFHMERDNWSGEILFTFNFPTL